MTQKKQGERLTRQTWTDILVVGAGPAGCTVAIGLHRLGYQVTLLHSPRTSAVCEGISARTLEGLRNAGLHRAADSVPAATQRTVNWNGSSGISNTEHLVQRNSFDEALLQDTAAAGVSLLAGRLRRVSRESEEYSRIEFQAADGETAWLQCRFLVEARGRSGPGTGTDQLRGPETLTLLQLRQGPSVSPGSMVSSFDGGWAWLANTGDGRSFVQFTVDAASVELPKRTELDNWCNGQLSRLQSLAAMCEASKPSGKVIARGSTSILQASLVSEHTLRVGDAAMAVDPLSGNGIFQSLSSALIAPAVINTLLQKSDHRELARNFYNERVRHTFLRFARTGRDFYRMETQWTNAQFWTERQDWPDDEPSHAELAPAFLGVQTRAVVENGFIAPKSVAVTSDQPLGVWHVGGVELAPLVQNLPPAGQERQQTLRGRVETLCAGDNGRKALLTSWLSYYRLLH